MQVAKPLLDGLCVALAIAKAVPGLLIDDLVDIAIAVIEIGITAGQHTVDPPLYDAVSRRER